MHFTVYSTVLSMLYICPWKNHLALLLSSSVRYVLICLARLEIAIPEQSYRIV